jgi:hypothetical protein
VLHRLRRIEEQAFVNLDDPGTRLLVQIGAVAGRTAVRARGAPSSPLGQAVRTRTIRNRAAHTLPQTDMLALVPSLQLVLSQVPDRHRGSLSLASVLLLVVCSMLSGAGTIAEIARWIQGPTARPLRELLALDGTELPRPTTLWRWLRDVDSMAIERALTDWLREHGTDSHHPPQASLEYEKSANSAVPCLAILDRFVCAVLAQRKRGSRVA